MRTPPFLVRIAASVAALLVLLLPGGTARGNPPAADAEKKDLFLETTSTVGLLEPPIPLPIPFGPEKPAGAKAPVSLGTLKWAILRIGEPQGALEGFLLGWRDAGKDASLDSLYVDPDADGDLANGGNGDLETTGDMRTRRTTLALKRPEGDPEGVSSVPFVFVRRAGSDAPWHAVPVGRRSAEIEIEGKTYSVALVDGDSDGAIKEGGRDVLWFDSNADGLFDPDPAARERLAIPAVVKAGPRLLKLSVPFASGARIKVDPVPSGEPQAGLPAPTPTLLSWRLLFAAASPTAVDERVAAVVGARSIHEDAVWTWLESLFDSLESPVRAAAVEGLGDPGFGPDKSADKLKEIAKSSDGSARHRALGLLAAHPGGGAGNFLKTVAEDRARPLGERIHALRSLAKFAEFLAVVKRHMLGSDPPELKAAAYDGLAERTPDDLNLHRQGLDLGSPAARGQAIAALGRLGDPQGLTLARKEATARQAPIRAGAVRVLVASGKRQDLMLALGAAQDDAPIEKFTDFNQDGKWQQGEPFVDGNGNGVFDPDAGIRRGLKDALRGERGRPEVLKFVLETMLDHKVDKEDWVREVAIDVVIDLDDPAARTALFKRLDAEKNRELLHKIIGAAGKAKQQVPIDSLLKIAKDDKDEGLRGAASAAAVEAALDDPRVRDLVKHLLRSKSWGDKVQGCEAAGYGRVVEAIPDVIVCLLEKRWNVRSAAIEALNLLHPKDAFEPLLVVMKEAGERTRLSLAANKALFRLTGKEMPDDPDQWRSWDAGHAGWQVPAEPPVAGDKGRHTVSKFFDIPLESKRLVFVIDRSGSMKIPDSSGERVRERWEIVVDQLYGVLKSLPSSGVQFNMIFFSQGVEAFKPKSVDATKEARDDARKFIAAIEPRGETNVWDALVMALDEVDVDTIILLTDGEPSVGAFTRGSDIIREVSIRNRFRRVVISTVSIGQDSGFLRELAARNHGSYVRK